MDPQPRQPQLPAQRAARDQVSGAAGAGRAGRVGAAAAGGLGGALEARSALEFSKPEGPRPGTLLGQKGRESPLVHPVLLRPLGFRPLATEAH